MLTASGHFEPLDKREFIAERVRNGPPLCKRCVDYTSHTLEGPICTSSKAIADRKTYLKGAIICHR